MIHFSGTFSNIQTNTTVTPHVSQEALGRQAQIICDRANRKSEGINPGVILAVDSGSVVYSKATNNDYSREKVKVADTAMKQWLQSKGMKEGKHFNYNA